MSSLRLAFWDSTSVGRPKFCSAGPERMDNTISAPSHLQDKLHLGNNPELFRNLKVRPPQNIVIFAKIKMFADAFGIKKQLYRVGEKHLDITQVPRHQGDAWMAIEAELLSTFPDIFKCKGPKTCLDLALQIIASHHCRRRFIFKHQGNEATEHVAKKRRLVMSVSVLSRTAMRKNKVKKREKAKKQLQQRRDIISLKGKVEKREKAKKQLQEKIIIDLTGDDDEHDKNLKIEPAEPKISQALDISNPQPRPAIKREGKNIDLTGDDDEHDENQENELAGPKFSQMLDISNPQAGPTTIKISSSRAASPLGPEDAGVTQVARFLNTCFPPMAHFLKHFVDFGCTSEEYLLAVSTWPTAKISHFLSQVSSCGDDEHKLSGMDMAVLRNHFISYFNNAQA
ncbi:hypothetical protein BYT27DRAFT_7239334 [Phlegmacium glaucopus]|nr:hypothetical protein BYT27DRAFT_7239334 [Phlegmacium glaucopus]